MMMGHIKGMRTLGDAMLEQANLLHAGEAKWTLTALGIAHKNAAETLDQEERAAIEQAAPLP